MISKVSLSFFSVFSRWSIYILPKKRTREKFLLLIIFILQFSIFNSYSAPETIQLNSGWQFRKVGEATWLRAVVPGTVHTDLLKNKIIADPFYGANEKNIQWIDSCNWEYQVYFDVDRDWMSFKHLDLLFEGIDTYANVYLNDSLIISSNNMFRIWKRDCKKFLKQKNNHLLVQFESAIRKGTDLAGNMPYTLPGEEKVFIRKAAYHFGWDWGPRFVTCGIWRPAKIVAWNDVKIESIQVIQHLLTDSIAQLTAHIEIQSDISGQLNLFINGGLDARNQLVKRVNVLHGTTVVDIPFSISNPKRWWCNGLGEPTLYKYTFGIGVREEINDQAQVQFGLRTIELIQEKDSLGKSFYFKLNGIPVFMKGANFIPADNFLPLVTKERYERIIRSAKEANMNMLRVWGGGIYEDDRFYDACDKNGILVWQDFMFACSMYPGDDAFVENVKQEIIDNVKRLRNHPSIALWCGNNEVDEGWHNWGWQKQYHYSEKDSSKIWNDYLNLFHKVIPGVLDSLLSFSKEKGFVNKVYWPSSPSIGWGKKESLKQGDSHYWGVWWGMEPFDSYQSKVGRFMSEYGFQGMPELNTINKFCDESEWSLKSMAMKNHQKHPTGFETIQTYLEREYKQPNNFENYVYVTQLLQAKGIRIAIEAHRIAKPYCMGTLYWQLNDCWPVVSWSSTDYFGEWKALHYEVKKAYQDILISPFVEDGKLKIKVVNDRIEAMKSTFKINLLEFNGKVKWSENKTMMLNKNSSQQLFSMDTSHLFKNISKKTAFLTVEMESDNKAVAQTIFYFASSKDLQLSKPRFSIRLKASASGRQELEMSSDVLAKNVYVSFPGVEFNFNDNYFDMMPGIKYLIWSLDGELKRGDEKKIVLKSLFDTYQ